MLMIYEIKPLVSSFLANFTHMGTSSHITMSKESTGIARLDSIFTENPSAHLGTVFMYLGALWAEKLGLEELIGAYTPLNDSVQYFYGSKGIAINGKNLYGNTSEIVALSQASLSRNNVGFKLVR